LQVGPAWRQPLHSRLVLPRRQPAHCSLQSPSPLRRYLPYVLAQEGERERARASKNTKHRCGQRGSGERREERGQRREERGERREERGEGREREEKRKAEKRKRVDYMEGREGDY